MGEGRGRSHPGPSDKCLDVLFWQRQLYCDALGPLRGVDTLLNGTGDEHGYLPHCVGVEGRILRLEGLPETTAAARSVF